MPTYEYECKFCGYNFEIVQRIIDKPKRKCPECHKKNALKKLIGLTTFTLKGDGWFKDGYSSIAQGNDNKDG
tara:strand:+ start:13406 stop:13621 length:216 start_codon:yes stop_codon:yes gene_type:complete